MKEDQIQRWYGFFYGLIQKYDDILINYQRSIESPTADLTFREKIAVNSAGTSSSRVARESLQPIERGNSDEDENDDGSDDEDPAAIVRNCMRHINESNF